MACCVCVTCEATGQSSKKGMSALWEAEIMAATQINYLVFLSHATESNTNCSGSKFGHNFFRHHVFLSNTKVVYSNTMIYYLISKLPKRQTWICWPGPLPAVLPPVSCIIAELELAFCMFCGKWWLLHFPAPRRHVNKSGMVLWCQDACSSWIKRLWATVGSLNL